MLTNEEAKYLLELEKVLDNPKQKIDLNNKKNRLVLISNKDSEYSFWLEITSNKKIILKTSVHHLESKSFIGLLRVDFKGSHQNPATIKDTLPEFLTPYAGKWFDPTEPHMHIYVEGYKPLSWAIPLINSDFPTKEIINQSDLSELIISFARKINLISKISHSTRKKISHIS